jgi:primosomal protein N' (replication factor Y)
MTITPKPDSVVYRVRVAVPVHLYDTFDYTLTKAQYEQAQVGHALQFHLDDKT